MSMSISPDYKVIHLRNFRTVAEQIQYQGIGKQRYSHTYVCKRDIYTDV